MRERLQAAAAVKSAKAKLKRDAKKAERAVIVAGSDDRREDWTTDKPVKFTRQGRGSKRVP